MKSGCAVHKTIMKSLANMIGDFAKMNRTPDFKASNPTLDAKSSLSPGRSAERRHSLNLAVGVSDEIPPFSVTRHTNRRQSVACTSDVGIDSTASAWTKQKEKGRRQSAPVVIGRGNEFHKKLAHLRQCNSLSSADEEDEEAEEKGHSRRGSKQAFMNFLEMAKGNKESSSQSEHQNKPTMRRGPGFAKPSERNDAHRASIVFINDDEVSSIQSSAINRL